MNGIELTNFEQQVLEHSADAQVTRRRRSTVIISGIVFAGALVGVTWLKPSSNVVAIVSVAYIAVTVFEKVAFANAVLAYKSVIEKLKSRIKALESQIDTQRT